MQDFKAMTKAELIRHIENDMPNHTYWSDTVIALEKERDELRRKLKVAEGALHRWLSWYGDDYGAKVFPDHKEGDRDQGALDIVYGRKALSTIRGEGGE